MEDDLIVEVNKLVKDLSSKVNKPLDLNRTTNISIVNALWGILTGERLELGDPKLLQIVTGFDKMLREGKTLIMTELISTQIINFQVVDLPSLQTCYRSPKWLSGQD